LACRIAACSAALRARDSLAIRSLATAAASVSIQSSVTVVAALIFAWNSRACALSSAMAEERAEAASARSRARASPVASSSVSSSIVGFIVDSFS
jgi:hypothetical protein